jgi:hypothetical protein
LFCRSDRRAAISFVIASFSLWVFFSLMPMMPSGYSFH